MGEYITIKLCSNLRAGNVVSKIFTWGLMLKSENQFRKLNRQYIYLIISQGTIYGLLYLNMKLILFLFKYINLLFLF